MAGSPPAASSSAGARAAKSGHSGLATRHSQWTQPPTVLTLCGLKESDKVTDMAGLDFVHLHVHSSYSLLEGALTISRLAELAKADRQPALALTDTDNMFGALEFSEKMSGYGIQPIIGCALAVDFGDTDHGPRNPNAQPERTRIVLLATRPRVTAA